MKCVASLLVLVLTGLVGGPALSQANDRTVSSAQVAPPEASPAQPSPGQIAAAMDLLDANGSMTNVATMLDSLAPIQAAEIRREHPDIDAETLGVLQKAVRTDIVARQDEFKRLIATVYARHFSEDDLRSLAAFYRSDVGRKYIERMPVLIKEVTPVGALWAEGVAAEAIRKVLNQMNVSSQHT
ncbi:MAG TPA: DUF2059 domain-containing protein [Rhizomicrobium sp.]|jgi:hypothetical protein|nr:DUF2059 domain-containing protein [Rhizomicrobium sp.]